MQNNGSMDSFLSQEPNFLELREEMRDMNRDNQEVPNEILITNIRDRPKFYCMRSVMQQSNCRNYDVMDCSVTFTVDRHIFILGVQVPSQILNVFDNLVSVQLFLILIE